MSAPVVMVSGVLVARRVGAAVEGGVEVVSAVLAVAVKLENRAEGALAGNVEATGYFGADVGTNHVLDSLKSGVGTSVPADVAAVLFACCRCTGPKVGASVEVTRAVKASVRGSREGMVGVVGSTVLVKVVVDNVPRAATPVVATLTGKVESDTTAETRVVDETS